MPSKMQFPKKHSKETIEAVCRLRTEGRSAREIAIELSLGSRCVVIGLWNRNMKRDSLGRITEYEPEVKERAFELLKEWSPASVAAQMGIPYCTIIHWTRRRRGEVNLIKSEAAKPVAHRPVRELTLDDDGFSAPVRETLAIPNYGQCKYVFGEDDTYRYCGEPAVTEYPRSYCAACDTRMRGKSLPMAQRPDQIAQRARASAREMMGLA